jgi:hypothetical protein
MIDELLEAYEVKNLKALNVPPPIPTQTNQEPRRNSTHRNNTGGNGGEWHRRKAERLEKITPATFTIRNDLEQVTSPVNSWKDVERDETVYLPHNIAQLGPISELLATGEVLFQSRSYVNPLIIKAVVGEALK